MVIQDKTLSDIWEALYSGDMIAEALDEEFITGNRRKEGAVIFCALVDKLKASDDDEEIRHLVDLIADMLRMGMSPFVVSSEGKRPYDLLPEGDDGLKEIFERYRAKPDDLVEEITELFQDIEKGRFRIESFIKLYDTGLDLSCCVKPGTKISLFQAVNSSKTAEKFIFLNWLKHYPNRFSQEVNEELQHQLEHQLGFKDTGTAVRECLIKGAKANHLRANHYETYFDYTLKASTFNNAIYLLLFGAHFGHNYPKPDWPDSLMAIWQWRKIFYDFLTNELVAAAYLGNLDVVQDYFEKKPQYLSEFINKNRDSLSVLARDCGWPGIRDYIRDQIGFIADEDTDESSEPQGDISPTGDDAYPDPEDGDPDDSKESVQPEDEGSSYSDDKENAPKDMDGSEESSGAETENAASSQPDDEYPDPNAQDGAEDGESGELGGGIGRDSRSEYIYNQKFKELTDFYKSGRIPAELHNCLKSAREEIAAWELTSGVKEDFECFFFAQSAEELRAHFDTSDKIDAFNKRKPLLQCLKRYCINSLCERAS
jgi:hypothetical protein